MNSIFIILTAIVSCIFVLLCSRSNEHYMFLAESIFPRWSIMKAGFIMSKYVQIVQASSMEQNLELIGTFFEDTTKPTISVSLSPSVNVQEMSSSTKEQLSMTMNSLLQFIFKPMRTLQNLRLWLFKSFRIFLSGLRAKFTKQRSTTISINDHVEVDIATITNLTPDQIHLIMDTYSTLSNNTTLTSAAMECNYPITPHMVFRYYTATDWAKLYNGKSYVEAIADTVLWRQQFHIDISSIRSHISNAVAYVSPTTDKVGRHIVYFKIAQNTQHILPDDYLALLLHTIKRAESISIASGSGEFIVVADLAGFSWSKGPPIAVIRKGISLLSSHYPYRVAGMYVLNSGGPFQVLWGLMKPLLSKKVINKFVVLGKRSLKRDKLLDMRIGLASLELLYGGEQPTVDFIDPDSVS